MNTIFYRQQTSRSIQGEKIQPRRKRRRIKTHNINNSSFAKTLTNLHTVCDEHVYDKVFFDKGIAVDCDNSVERIFR